MTTRGDKDPRVVPFPMHRVTRTAPKPPKHRVTCNGMLIVRPETSELVVWSRVNDPKRW